MGEGRNSSKRKSRKSGLGLEENIKREENQDRVGNVFLPTLPY